MPIVGLTDQGAAFPRLGELRKGAPRPVNGTEAGEDLTYFRFTSDDADMVSAFAHAYGEQPRAVNVILPYATPGENFEAWREEWVAGGLRRRCNGQICERHLTAEGDYSDEPLGCAMNAKPPCRCRPVGRLSVIIPELRRMALVTVLTGSIWDIMTLDENLCAVAIVRGGDLRGVPFILRRRSRGISTPGRDASGKPKRVRREKWLLSLEPNPDWVVRQLAAAQQAAMPLLTQGATATGAPQGVDPETGEIEDDDLPWEARAEDEERVTAPEPDPPIRPGRDVAQLRTHIDAFNAVAADFRLSKSGILKEMGWTADQLESMTPAQVYLAVAEMMKGRLV